MASACKLVPRGNDQFSNEVVSAFSEALNNVVLHGGVSSEDEVEIEIDLGEDRLTLRLKDHGISFDPRTAPSRIWTPFRSQEWARSSSCPSWTR